MIRANARFVLKSPPSAPDADDDSPARRDRNRADARRTRLSVPAPAPVAAPAPTPPDVGAPLQAALRGRFSDPVALAAYVAAGRGTVTVRSNRTGDRFTFRLRVPADHAGRPDPTRRPIWVSVLTGPENTSDYAFIGTLWLEDGRPAIFHHSPKSRFAATAPAAQAARWFARLATDAPTALLARAEVWHEGRCGRCGRTLTVPESIESGFGPECITLVGRRS